MKISSANQRKMKILAMCDDYMTTKEISDAMGINRATISQYMCDLSAGKYVIRVVGNGPWKYKRNPEMTFVQKTPRTRKQVWKAMQEREAAMAYPILPKGPLSFIRECEHYKPPVGRKVEEKHGSWIHRKAEISIGRGSCAHLESA